MQIMQGNLILNNFSYPSRNIRILSHLYSYVIILTCEFIERHEMTNILAGDDLEVKTYQST